MGAWHDESRQPLFPTVVTQAKQFPKIECAKTSLLLNFNGDWRSSELISKALPRNAKHLPTLTILGVSVAVIVTTCRCGCVPLSLSW
jgi:hypothetical protein